VGSQTDPFNAHPIAPVRIDPAVDESRLAWIIRIVTWLILGMAVESMALAALSHAPAYVAQALVFVAAAAWMSWARARLGTRGAAWFASRVAMVMLVTLLGLVLLVPSTAANLMIAPIVPFLIVLPYLGARPLRRLALGIWVVALVVAVVAAYSALGTPAAIPVEAAVLGLVDTSLTTALVLYLLWGYRERLLASSRDMARLMRLSRDVSGTLDPTRVAELLARHLQETTRADLCVISVYRSDEGEVRTFASWPPEHAATYDRSYMLDEFPLTRRVVEGQELTSMHIDDAEADAAEVAVLRDEGSTALLMVPLVAGGETIGVAEITRDGRRFGQADLALAASFAAEAAMALENARLHEELRRQAFHDGLTRLANRALFTDRLNHALARIERGPARVAVLFADIDSFKSVNDQLGHVRGDHVLLAVADRLRGCVRGADTVARLGGDEFAVLLEDLVELDEAEHVARRMVEAIAEPMLLGDTQITIGISIGIAFSSHETTADMLLREADTAMYRAKSAGKARVEVFSPALRRGVAERRALKRSLRKAVEREELRLQYQPIVRLVDGSVAGLEALVRWDAPGVQRRMPEDFIAISEESGSIVTIGRWVLEAACRQARTWQLATRREDLSVSVNLSARQFQDPALGRTLAEAIALADLPPESLILEITESVLMQHTQRTMDVLGELRASGVRVAVDDFGTGYSSLSYLQRFPIDVLKVDRAFVADAVTDQGAILARAIVEIGNGLDLQVIAEGIERPDQLRLMQSFGCEYGQGYLFSTPLDSVDVLRLLREDGSRAASSDSDARMSVDAVA
jgi:diguanylate cyclase (GGDEF)-like protein